MSPTPTDATAIELPPGVTLPPGEDELPYDDGEPMESDLHREQMWLLIEVLKDHLSDREDAYVAGNMAVYYSELQVKKNDFKAPDVYVAFDTERRARKSWVGWQEGKLPDLVIELLSPSTERVDRGEKMRIYAQLWRLPEYYLFDPDTGLLEGYRLDPRRVFVPIQPDEHGRLRSEIAGCSFGLWTGVYGALESTWMRVWDGAGELVPTGRERAAQETRRADEEAQRASQEAQRASQEAQRAEELAAKLAAYEARFGKL